MKQALTTAKRIDEVMFITSTVFIDLCDVNTFFWSLINNLKIDLQADKAFASYLNGNGRQLFTENEVYHLTNSMDNAKEVLASLGLNVQTIIDLNK